MHGTVTVLSQDVLQKRVTCVLLTGGASQAVYVAGTLVLWPLCLTPALFAIQQLWINIRPACGLSSIILQ